MANLKKNTNTIKVFAQSSAQVHLKVRKSKCNINNVYLTDFMTYKEAVSCMPKLDDIVTGVSMLCYGNNKPLSKNLLFSMLRDLDEINTNTVMEYTRYAKTTSSRLAQHLRVLVNAFDSIVEGK